MIYGAHIVIYSKNPQVDRIFFRDVLQFPAVDAGHGWLIFAMPPLEAAFHAADDTRSDLYLMCDDIAQTLAELESKKVPVSSVTEQRWGKVATFTLPGGGKIGIYQPTHLSPLKQNR